MEIPYEEDGVDEGADYSRVPAAPARLAVPEHLGGDRLDVALAALLPEHSRSRLQQWIRNGLVVVDGEVVCEPKTRVLGGERLMVTAVSTPQETAFSAENVPLDVVFEDESIVVIDKPAGLVVHPGHGNWSGTLLNGLLYRYPDAALLPRAGIVHRLDKDTSGLMVVARSLVAQTELVRQLQARTVKRQYLALVVGRLPITVGVVDAPIGRHPTLRTKMAVLKGGKPAITRYRLIKRFLATSLVECRLETGRTHQIRVHMASLGYPLVGDALYRGRVAGPSLQRQALHARRLGLIHPLSGLAMEWYSRVPDDMGELIASLRAEASVPAAPYPTEDWAGEEADDAWDGVVVVRD